ncbi:MAG: penicillin binding protein transpeptidase protein [Cyanobacteria bacterium RYN_339]|nr:penicillin binding protein transpeptidase protein [Cyanobacteria bacterium RYN_339]
MLAPDYAPLVAYDACFAMVEAHTGEVVARMNPARCARRFVPCSTFKVPLALMALDHGLITETSRFKWDRKPHQYAGWNADQTTTTWLSESVVWVSQLLAPKLGRATMHDELAAFGYGDADTSGAIDSFWLTAFTQPTLHVSADEQLAFWQRLENGKLPVKHASLVALRHVLPSWKDAQGDLLTGKTGSGRLPSGRQIGWFVGTIKAQGHTYALACNLEAKVDQPAGLETRRLVRGILASVGWWVEPTAKPGS